MKKQVLLIFSLVLAITGITQTQPTQPATSYGGLAASYSSVTTFNCDDGATGFMLYIPNGPHADSLPLVVFDHGFGEWNPLRYGHWIDHIVKRGNIVIFPRYQKSEYTTPSTSFTPNAVTGILRALDTIKNHPTWTQPKLDKVFYIGHSYGGLISANLATNFASYKIPKPKGLLMACPGYGQYPGGQLASYSAMDSSIYVLDIFERNDSVVDSTFALQVFNQTISVPYAHKNLAIHFADSTGTPRVTSTHGESSCVDSAYDNGDRGIVMAQAAYAYTDATDFYCYWKLFDALEDCSLNGNGCTTAFGDTYAQRYMGQWSNGNPVRPLNIRPAVSVTSLNRLTTNQKTEIFPNPSSSGIFNFHSSQIQIIKIEVYNVLGEKVFAAQYLKGNTETSININNQPEGLYFYRILDKDNVVMENGKLVLVHK